MNLVFLCVSQLKMQAFTKPALGIVKITKLSKFSFLMCITTQIASSESYIFYHQNLAMNSMVIVTSYLLQTLTNTHQQSPLYIYTWKNALFTIRCLYIILRSNKTTVKNSIY